MDFWTNGTARMYLDSAGNLGLGVTPATVYGESSKFTIDATGKTNGIYINFNGTGADKQIFLTNGGNANCFVGTDNIAMTFGTGNTERARISSDGTFRVKGAGTAGSTDAFQVAGTAPADSMVLNSSGNVGIGTASPSFKLHVNGSASQTLLVTSTAGDVRLGLDNSGAFYSWIDSYRASGAMAFGTNNTERARITSGGFFKATNTGGYVSSTGSSHELRSDVADEYVVRVTNSNASPGAASQALLSFTASAPNNTSAYFLDCTDNTARRAYILSNGGIANYSANDVNLSDRREKTNFAPAGSYLDKICAIPVQTFNYIDQNLNQDSGLTLGVVAQDVQAVAPELVMEGNWGSKDDPKMRLSIYQTDLQYALMKCIQEQQTLITALTARIAALESSTLQ
jgi:hypothetical protein